MYTLTSIESAEREYLNTLEDYFTEKWGKTILYSHGIEHHKRVWYYAKEILGEIAAFNKGKFSIPPDKLLIGCYLHDLGMSVDPGRKHGIISSNLCREFLLNHQLDTSDFTDLLEAIESHDNKEYQDPVNNLSITTVLSVADDLDAFGYIGIYRYLEIYLARGIDSGTIGREIIGNARGRFDNFSSLFGKYKTLVDRHYSRFNILCNFFAGNTPDAINNQTISNRGKELRIIIDLVKEIIIKGTAPEDFCRETLITEENTFIKEFCLNLLSESNDMKKKIEIRGQL